MQSDDIVIPLNREDFSEKITKHFRELVENEEGKYFSNLGIVKKTLLVQSVRKKRIDDFFNELMNQINEHLSKNKHNFDNLRELAVINEPVQFKNLILDVVKAIEDKNAHENSWLLSEIKDEKLDEIKNIDGTEYSSTGFDKLTKLYYVAYKIYAAEITNRSINNYSNKEVSKLSTRLYHTTLVDKFRYVSKNLVYANDYVPYNHDKYQDPFYIENIIKSLADINFNIPNVNFIKDKDEFLKKVKDVLSQKLTENFLYNHLLVGSLKIYKELGDYDNVIFSNYIKNIDDKHDLLGSFIKFLKDNGNTITEEEYVTGLRNISFMYKDLTEEEIQLKYQEEFNKCSLDVFNERFILLYSGFKKTKILGKLLDLSIEDLKKFLNNRNNIEDPILFDLFNSGYGKANVDLVYLMAQDIYDKKYSALQKEKFISGETDFGFEREASISFSILKKDIDAMLNFEISAKQKELNETHSHHVKDGTKNQSFYIMDDKFIFKMSANKCHLTLLGDYAVSLNNDELIEILVTVVKDKFLKRKMDTTSENIIHEKELAYKLSLKDSNDYKSVRKKV